MDDHAGFGRNWGEFNHTCLQKRLGKLVVDKMTTGFADKWKETKHPNAFTFKAEPNSFA